MKNCCNYCIIKNSPCQVDDCKHWIDYKDDLNCTLIAVEKHGAMTLRETSERMGISFVRVKQIQDKAIKKLSNLDVNFN
tara:strand:+ start:5526 stop:5762 length:237 start_codon:yes stop_codon:yes gene_type:complete